MFSVKDIVAIAVQVEQNAEKVFRNAAKKSAMPPLVALLKWLANEEVRHAKCFSELKTEGTRKVEAPDVEAFGENLLRGILGKQTFSLQAAKLSQMDDAVGILEAAIEFERDTVLFYEMIRSFVKEKKNRAVLKTIIQEENRHIQLLHGFLADGSIPGEIKKAVAE